MPIIHYSPPLRMASLGPFVSSSSLIGQNKGCQKLERALLTSLAKCIKPRNSSDRMDPSLCTAGKGNQWQLPLCVCVCAYLLCITLSLLPHSAGVGRTGVFITLSIVLERMRYEGVVDIFHTAKTLRTQRPAMVQTEVWTNILYCCCLPLLESGMEGNASQQRIKKLHDSSSICQ